MICSKCDGRGNVFTNETVVRGGRTYDAGMVKCDKCGGTGKILPTKPPMDDPSCGEPLRKPTPASATKARPTYETQKDLDGEREIFAAMEAKWAVKVQKLPVSYRVDAALVKDGAIVGFAEVKDRKCSLSTFPTIFISLGKWQAMNDLYNDTGKFVYWVVRFTDALCAFMVAGEEAEDLRWGGRTVQQRDTADVEPMVHIETTRFTPLDRFGLIQDPR